MTVADNKKRVLPTLTLEQSFRLCERMVNGRLGQHLWMIGNVPREMRPYLNAILALTVRSEKLCDIHIGRAARSDLLEDLREDFRNNFMEEESTDQFPALLETMKRHEIPQQYLHDIVAAADMGVRIDRYSEFDQWLQLGYRIGGGTLLSLIPVIGFEKRGYESAAIACGQAIYLTHLLGDIGDEIQKLEYFLPTSDLAEFEVDLAKHNPNQPDNAMLRLIQRQVDRIEERFNEGGQLVHFLTLDGQRVMKTVISVYWKLLMKIRTEPGKIFQEQPDLSRRERFGFKLKHLLGLEGGVSVLPGDGHHPERS